jgi:Domain of unknown function (DUF4623)
VRLLSLLLLLLLGLNWVQSACAQSYMLTNLWSITPRTNTIINNDGNNNFARGMAYNPVTGHILVVSRTPVPDFGTNVFGTNGVYILNATNGAVLGKLAYDTNVINGGNFPVNMVGVTDDGVIYVGNLTAATANGPFKLYRWADESSQPQLVYSGDPSGGFLYGTSPQRFGDSIAVRGTGAGTQILLGTFNQTLGLLTTADGINFTANLIITGMAASDSRWGVAWGSGSTFWVKQANGNLRWMGLDLVANTATFLTNIALAGATVVPGGPLDVDPSRNLVATIDTTNHKLLLYDISDPSNPIQQDTTRSFPAANANGNFVGAVAFRNGKLFAMESNNGILAYALGQTNLPATISIQPTSITLWEGATYSVSAGYGGTRPFSYQWRFAGTNIPGATQTSLLIPNISLYQQGAYSVAVSNALGGAVSSSATLTVTPGTASAQVTNLWNVLAGTRRYLTYRPIGDSVAGYKDYGMAINPVNTNIIVVTRLDPTNIMVVLDIQGNFLHYVDYSTLGVDQMNKVDVADDGAVYVCNIVTSTNAPFKVYGFGDDSASNPDRWVAFNGDPGNGQTASTNGWGTTFSVRGGGLNTEILIGAQNGAFRTFAILRPNPSFIFSSTLITVPGAPAGFCRLGLDWGPGTNTVWAKTASGMLYLIEYDLTTGGGTVLNSYQQAFSSSPPVYRFVPPTFTGLKYDPATKLLAGLQNSSPPSPVSMLVYDVSDPDSGPFQVDQEFSPTYNGDIEYQGNVDFANGYLVALGVNNGLMVCQVNTNFVSLPRILTQPASATSYVGTFANFSVVADSTSGLSYQWYHNGEIVTNATDATLALTNLETNQAGLYTVRVFNSGGYRESAPATLAVLVPYTTAQMTNIWSLAPGSRSYLNTDYAEYGMAFNPATSNLLVISLQTGSPVIAVLDALTGDEKHFLDVSVVSGGAKALHKIDVADDGVVYAGNLTSASATTPFTLYRWANDAADTIATVAFSGDPAPTKAANKGCGYTFDVRGSGVNTEILVGIGAWGATTNVVSILKTTDGTNFFANEIKVAAAPAGFSRLGACFGAGNTFWAKAWRDEAVALGKLYLVQYDLVAGTNSILKTYQTTQVSSTITTLAYNDTLKLLAGIATDNADNVMMYNVADLVAGPQLRDQVLFQNYNPSIEANGDLDYGGNTYLFALCENNGIMAFRIDASYIPPYTSFKILAATPAAGGVTLVWQANDGAKYQVQHAETVTGTWQDLGGEVTAVGRTASYKDTTPDGSKRFYRVLAK